MIYTHISLMNIEELLLLKLFKKFNFTPRFTAIQIYIKNCVIVQVVTLPDSQPLALPCMASSV